MFVWWLMCLYFSVGLVRVDRWILDLYIMKSLSNVFSSHIGHIGNNEKQIQHNKCLITSA